MDEEQILLEKAKEKIEVAKDLLQDGHYSDTVSRAYYSMFFSARALLHAKNIHPRTHRGVMVKLGEEYVSKGKISKQLFSEFASAQEEREKADYGLLSNTGKEDAADSIDSAEKFLACAKKILEKK